MSEQDNKIICDGNTASMMTKLNQLILKKVDEGIFVSQSEAVECIEAWLNNLEKEWVLQQMRQEDA